MIITCELFYDLQYFSLSDYFIMSFVFIFVMNHLVAFVYYYSSNHWNFDIDGIEYNLKNYVHVEFLFSTKRPYKLLFSNRVIIYVRCNISILQPSTLGKNSSIKNTHVLVYAMFEYFLVFLIQLACLHYLNVVRDVFVLNFHIFLSSHWGG